MSDVSEEHRPKRQGFAGMEEDEKEESLYVKKVEDEFVHIKEEQEEYLIRMEHHHIEEHQQPHPLKKEEEDPPYVKVEVVDIPEWTGQPLKGEDGSQSEASRGPEPQSGSSNTKEGFQADNLIARPSESDDFTSHSLFCFRKYLGPKRQESGSPGIKEEVEHPQMKKEEPEDHQRQKRDEQLPIKKEEVELTLEEERYIKEEDVITKPTGEPLKIEEALSETSRGAETPSSSSSSTEGLQADSFTAPLSDSKDAMSHLPDNDDVQKKANSI
ncbi:cilia- and flagella-associated protein 251-like isoform X2 [Corythoichthys intestinalis]|uniref:cilia- and flagella-associated protein 251-like isoform X2 n=1 Tax=Corythoichthys intestinalis TaxID=161448 RepID=UPI0025A4EA98|nr:cilia- and flagella-associated protein 251-like isoform X2 [Corythoichthys intestinalis]